MFRTVIAPVRRVQSRAHSTLTLPVKLGWPTPWLKPAEVEEHLFPLQRYSQWRVEFVATKVRSHPTLMKTFHFQGGRTSLNFMRDIIDIAEKEKHHPTMLEFNECPDAHVNIGFRTHSAMIPQELASYIEHARGESVPISKHQGITVRDIRIAQLLDDHFREKYVAKDMANEVTNEYTPFETVEELLEHLSSALSTSTRLMNESTLQPDPR